MNSKGCKKINILQLITGLGIGGAEKVAYNLSKYISKDDFNVFVLSLSEQDDMLEEFLSSGIDTTVMHQPNSLSGLLILIKKIHAFVNLNDIEIIHAHLSHSIIVSSFLKLLNPSLKIVFSSHSLNIGSKLREIVVWLFKSFRNMDIISSEDILKFFYRANYKVIPYGIKIEEYDLNLVKNNKFTFIAVGRLEAVKNHIALINIAQNLRKKYLFEIQIVGSGSLMEELDERIAVYKLRDFVKILGLRRDIPELLNKSHCLLMPSIWEGLPIVILEAGASRLPIISTPVGSIPSVLNNDNAFVENIEGFESSMVQILNQYDNARLKAEKLFEEINEKHSVMSFVKDHELIYKNLMF